MNRFKFDKIQIVGILFLLITLFVGIFVAINKGFSFNINEKAGVDGGMDTLTGATEGRNYGTINDQQNGEDVSTNAAPTVFIGKSDCGGKCKIDQICSVYINKNVVTDKQLYYCKQRPIPPAPPAPPGTQTTVVPPAAAPVPIKTPVVRPTLTPALRTATGGYDFQTAKNDLAAPNTAGYDFKNGEISGYYKGNDGLYYAIGGTGNNPDNYIEERLRDLQIANSIVNQESRINEYEQTIVDAAAVEAAAAREVMLQKMQDAKSAALTTNILAYNQPIDSLEQMRLDRANAQSQQAKQEYINTGLLALSNATNQQFQSENANLNESITPASNYITLRQAMIDNTQGTASIIVGIKGGVNITPTPVTTVSDVATIRVKSKNTAGNAVIKVETNSKVAAKNIDTNVAGTFGQATVQISNVVIPTPTATATTFPNWDVNEDGYINVLDIGIVSDNYDSSSPTNPRADVNRDGFINILDIGIIVDHYI